MSASGKMPAGGGRMRGGVREPHMSREDLKKSLGKGSTVWRLFGFIFKNYKFRFGVVLVCIVISALATLASSLFPDDDVVILIGAHADDAAGNAYADCSDEFLESMDDAIYIGTYKRVSIQAPFGQSNKADVVKTGLALGVPYNLTWSCYNGGDKPCGVCGTCIDRAKAFSANNVIDPLLEG